MGDRPVSVANTDRADGRRGNALLGALSTQSL